MVFKVSWFLVSDSKLCHLLRPRKLHLLGSANNIFSSTHSSHKFLNRKYVLVYGSAKHSTLKMSSNSSSPAPFKGRKDRFEGITVFSDREPCDVSDFSGKLKSSLESWSASRTRGVWFKVHLKQCDWVPILVKNGFKYHHAKEEYVMLYLWLPTHEDNNIPNYAHTMIGVGAVVVNERDQVLVVQEKYFFKMPMWKLPGGYVEPGENLADAAIREVLEETGIQTEFVSILTLRHGHGGMFECSDIYIVVNLKALSGDIQKCEREIAECQWMDIEEYLTHPYVHELNRFFVDRLLHQKKHNIKIDCHQGIHQLLQKPFTVFSVVKTDDVEDIAKNPFASIAGTSNMPS